jgi:hypothetical protein
MTIVRVIWASPYTLLGLAVGGLALLTGGRAQKRGRAIEFYGGAAAWLLEVLLGGPAAMTLGHVVLGLGPRALDFARDHEAVHIRQYERWGPLFGPAYILCSLVLWLRGRDAYRDNPFEREAFREAP